LDSLVLAMRLLQLGHLVALLAVAELLLNGLHLLVEIVLALGLLHLALDPRADALFHLQHRDLALHQGIDPLQALVDRQDFQQLLLLADLDRDVGRHRVGELGGIVDLGDGRQGFLGNLLVELHIAFELRNDGAGERFGLAGIAKVDRGDLGGRLDELAAIGEPLDPGALIALHQHLDGAVGQLQQLQHRGQRAHGEDGVGRRIVVGGIALGHQQNPLVVAHHVLERADRLLAPDEQGHDHVRKDHDIAQRQDRIQRLCRRRHGRGLFGHSLNSL
jgi:hypothetical protein